METTVASATSGESKIRELILGSIKRNTKQYTMFIALIAIWVIFALVTDRVFLTPRNLSNLFVQTVTTAILAIGMVLVIVTGHIDLSVGSVLGFAGAVCAMLMIKFEWGVAALPAVARAGSLTVARAHVEVLEAGEGESEMSVKLGAWLSNTKARRAKLTPGQLAQLGLDWA